MLGSHVKKKAWSDTLAILTLSSGGAERLDTVKREGAFGRHLA